MITRETDYAVRVVLCLAAQADLSSPVSTSAIAAEMGIPYRFLRRVVRRMTRERLIRTFRGKGGGIRLSRSPQRLSLYDVLRAIDPRGMKLNVCLLDQGTCTRKGTCAVHDAMEDLQSALEKNLRRVTFGRLTRPARG